jgi:formimidoylglutamate deiminase
MTHVRGFAKGFFNGQWYEPFICEYDYLGHVLQISDQAPSDITIDLRTFVQSPPNGHSHCFQFAMLGLTEFTDDTGDDFWAWRASMYQVALSISPKELKSIARALYTLMKINGYRSVTEFHYLHQDLNGEPFNCKTYFSDILIEAALEVGLNIVLVPVYYRNGGFNTQAYPDQKRFIFKDVDDYLDLIHRLDQQWGNHPYVKIGKGIHSLRAASQEDILKICSTLEVDRPFHIHISEQTKEVDTCIEHWGQRPVEWLLNHVNLNTNYHLVHATHLNEGEIKGIIQSGASITLCPSTEGNLGDGIFPLPKYMKHKGKFWIGSDSHVSISPFEELRLLDYSQRFLHRSRGLVNILHQGQRGEILWKEIVDVDEYGDQRGLFFSGILLKANNLITSAKKLQYQISALVYGGYSELIDTVIINGVESSREIDPQIMENFAHVVSRLG